MFGKVAAVLGEMMGHSAPSRALMDEALVGLPAQAAVAAQDVVGEAVLVVLDAHRALPVTVETMNR